METLITVLLWYVALIIFTLISVIVVVVVKGVISEWSYKLKEGDILVDKVWEEREVEVTEVSKDYSRVRYVIVEGEEEEEGTLVESSIDRFLDTYKLKS